MLAEYYLSASEKWEVPQGAFDVLLASSSRIQGCADWDVETFWTAVADAANRSHPLLWLQRSTRHSQGDHAIVTFSKPTPVGGRASRKRRRTTQGAAMDADRHQQALTSNRTVRSSSSSSVGQAANRVTTTMKDVWDHVKGGNGNVLESWNTAFLFFSSLWNRAFMSLLPRCF